MNKQLKNELQALKEGEGTRRQGGEEKEKRGKTFVSSITHGIYSAADLRLSHLITGREKNASHYL